MELCFRKINLKAGRAGLIWEEAGKKVSKDLLHPSKLIESPLWGAGNPRAEEEMKRWRPDESKIDFI